MSNAPKAIWADFDALQGKQSGWCCTTLSQLRTKRDAQYIRADIAQRLAEALDACLAKLEHCRNGSPTFAVNEKRKARKALAAFDALMGEENG